MIDAIYGHANTCRVLAHPFFRGVTVPIVSRYIVLWMKLSQAVPGLRQRMRDPLDTWPSWRTTDANGVGVDVEMCLVAPMAAVF